jgi:hypothetical protein
MKIAWPTIVLVLVLLLILDFPRLFENEDEDE